MKNTFLALCGAALVVGAVSGNAMAGECSTATLKGHYTYWLQGADAAGKPYAEVGSEHFDGAGKIESLVAPSGSATVEKSAGTYTVNDDCTGTTTYESGEVFNIFVAPSGDSFVFSSAKAGDVKAGENSRVAND